MTFPDLSSLGWTDALAQTAGMPVGPDAAPARLTEIGRDRVTALGADGPLQIVPAEATTFYAVGDWVLTDGLRVLTRLPRRTEIARRAAGPTAERQLIAANVDTLAIVTSCNHDFNIARLERYLAMTAASGAAPLIVLTKADLALGPPEDYARSARGLQPGLPVMVLNARTEAEALSPFCGPGLTLGLVGSSGVGKTTLQNHLTGVEAATGAIREDDAKGRHTTTARMLRRTLAGGWLIDTPGMRELQLSDAAEGIDAVFSDLVTLAAACRFRDCTHEGEPGCAVQGAIAEGLIDPARLTRWRKLAAEDRIATEDVALRRARDRAFGKLTRSGRERGRAKRNWADAEE